MKRARLNSHLPRFPRLGPLSGIVGALALVLGASAQVAITSVTYGPTTNGSDRTADNLTFLNQVTRVEAVTSSAGTYNLTGSLASSASFRRNTSAGNANSANVYYQYSSAGDEDRAVVIGKGDRSPTLSEVMLSGDLTQGLRNPFANGSSASSSNIERIDFNFTGGYTVQAGDAIVLFDLENYGDHGDGFRIAAFTSVGTVNGANNAPTAYANTGLLIEPDSMGDPVATPTGTNARYLLSTTTRGDSLASNQSLTSLDSSSGTPGEHDLFLVGLLIRFTDLGLNVGDTIYGYSLMAGDVSASHGSDLVNWTNGSVYRTDTDASTWGNADFAGFGAQIARPVPEPPLFGAGLLAIGTAWIVAKRRRRLA